MKNPWIEHVESYAEEHNISYKDALKDAAKTYKSKSKSQNSELSSLSTQSPEQPENMETMGENMETISEPMVVVPTPKKPRKTRRKSKRKLLNESFLMILFALLLAFINFLIPNKMRNIKLVNFFTYCIYFIRNINAMLFS